MAESLENHVESTVAGESEIVCFEPNQVHEDALGAESLENHVGPTVIEESEVMIFQQKQEPQESVVDKWPGWPGYSVFRILVPSQKVGEIIGRKGEHIKKLCEETKSRIRVLDAPPGTKERAVVVSAKEDTNASISPAMDGLLCVHKFIIDDLNKEHAHGPSNNQIVVTTRLLVVASQARSLIGKQGSNIKSIQQTSSTVVRILDETPVFALPEDRVVEIRGEPSDVHRAVELLIGQLRKFLVDRSVIPLFEMNMSTPDTYMDYSRHPLQPSSHAPDMPSYAGGASFGGSPSVLHPYPRDNFCPPYDFPPIEKQFHNSIAAYGRELPPAGGHLLANNQGLPVHSKLTRHLQIPLGYADAVIGISGATISYIRRTSGAKISVQEMRGVSDEMTVEISGSATEVQTAQQLIQNFMAEAAEPARNSAAPADQGYSAYSSQGSTMYMHTPANAGLSTTHSVDEYASSYVATYNGY